MAYFSQPFFHMQSVTLTMKIHYRSLHVIYAVPLLNVYIQHYSIIAPHTYIEQRTFYPLLDLCTGIDDVESIV